MGDETPDPVQIQCPGCESRFRLTPKKGRLPSGDIPCPKCFEEIPVENGEVVTGDEEDDGDEKQQKDSAPGFGVVDPVGDGESDASDEQGEDFDEEEKEAVAELEKRARDLPSDSDDKSTMAGFPGVGRNPESDDNPFNKSGDHDNKTAAVDEDMLRQVVEESSAAEETDESPENDAGDEPERSFDRAHLPDTSPRLVDGEHAQQLAAEDSTAAPTPADDEDDNTDLRDTAERDSATQSLRETAENPSVPGETDAPPEAQSPADESDDSPSSSAKKAGVLGKIKKKQMTREELSSKQDFSDSSDSSDSSGGAQLPRPGSVGDSDDETTSGERRPETTEDQSAPSDDAESSGEDSDSSLSNLFKKVRERRGADDGDVREKLESAAGDESGDMLDADDDLSDLADEVDLTEEELEEFVGESGDEDRDDGSSLPTPSDDTAGSSGPETVADPGEPTSAPDDEHSGLFDEVESPAEEQSAPDSAVRDVSEKSGRQRTQSMLARLKKGGDDEGAEVGGTAGEKHGSGYIRLPTDEIQDVLGQGEFRLKIDGVVYEPVDKKGLIKLIKGGVLLGAEEIAEAGGDWMPISEHPVFGELRRKMASEAHEVLSRLGADDQPADDEPESDSTAPSEPAASAESTASGPDASGEQSTDAPEQPRSPETTGSEAGGPVESPESSSPSAPPEAPAFDDDATSSPASGGTAPLTPVDSGVDSDAPDSSSDSPEPADEGSAVPGSAEAAEAPDEQPTGEPSTEPQPTEPSTEPPPAEPQSIDDPEPIDDEPSPAPEPAASASGDTLADEFDEAPPAERRSSRGTSTAVVAGTGLGVALLAAAGALLLSAPGQELLESTVGWSPADDSPSEQETEQDREARLDEQRGEAVAAASRDLVDALPESVNSAQNDKWIDHYLDQGDTRRAADIMEGQYEAGRRDRDFLLRLSRTHHDNGDYAPARRAALTGIAEFPEDEALFEAHRRAVEDDETLFTYDYRRLRDPARFEADGLYDVSDHRGVRLARTDGEGHDLLFKPRREDWEHGWRAEIASWRFCELVVCHFDVLEVEPAMVTREFVDGLEGTGVEVDRLLADARWETVDIDGEQVEALRGTLERVPATSPAPFPVEYRPLWRDWLTAGSSTDFTGVPARQTLTPLKGLDDGRFLDELVAVAGDMPTGELARSVSSLLMFDYLTNNWERFANRTENYGRNNPVADSTMISRHNGHAFQARASRRVRGRFEWTSRFSRSTVATIRALDRETTYDVLFPERGPGQERRLDVMWDQRSNMLDRIDELVARHGEDDVLLFD